MLSKPPASHPDVPASRRGFSLTLLTRARNPSKVARALYLSPHLAPHTLLSGSTAESIGEKLGEELVDPSYFWTEARWREHRRNLGLPETPFPPGTAPDPDDTLPLLDQLPTGTVGAVALDARGCISCVTSTGGKTNKLVGRIGMANALPHLPFALTCSSSNNRRYSFYGLRILGRTMGSRREIQAGMEEIVGETTPRGWCVRNGGW